MAQLDFPATPSANQQFTSGGTIWTWDGAKWVAGATTSAFAPVNSPVFTGDPQAPQPAAGDADASIATTKFVSDAVATSLHDVGRNYLHNSQFNIAQRGIGPWTTGVYTVDRWRLGISGDTVSVTQAAMTDAVRSQVGDEAAAFYVLNTFTGNAAAGSLSVLNQPIESVRRLGGKTVTVSFYAWASATLKLGVSIDQYFGSGGSPSAGVNGTGQAATLTTTATRYILTFAVPSVAGKTLGTDGADSTALMFWYSSGSTNNSRAGGIGVQSGSIAIWGVQLEIGTVATPLEKLDPVTQLQQCQRFFQVGAAASYGGAVAGAVLRVPIRLPVTMRAMPTINTQNFTTSGGITSPSVTVYSIDTVVIAGTQSTTSYSADCTFSVTADL